MKMQQIKNNEMQLTIWVRSILMLPIPREHAQFNIRNNTFLNKTRETSEKMDHRK